MANVAEQAAVEEPKAEKVSAEEKAARDLMEGFSGDVVVEEVAPSEPETEQKAVPEDPVAEDSTDEVDDDDEEEEEAESSDDSSETETVTVTKDKFDKLLKSVEGAEATSRRAQEGLEKAFGHIGNQGETIRQMQALNAKSGHGTLTAEDLAELSENYPEIAEPLLKAYTKARARAQVQPTPRPPAQPPQQAGITNDVANAMVEEATYRVESNMLNKRYPDWQEKVQLGTPFRKWLEKQPEDYRKQTEATTSPTELIEAFDRFNKQAVVKGKKKASREAKLKRAEVSKGDRQSTARLKSDQQQLEDGFYSR